MQKAMHRTQVLLTREQLKKLQAEAKRRRVSLAQLIREAVDAYLRQREREELRRRALAAVGRFSSGQSGISQDHDRELERIYAEGNSDH